ncbi:hypothetical protein C8F04DRAFT_1249280 [Mycena alexandri]|uniref:Uncharacterized protein n=1 Tax=Mycena alexandri TaxID=1745969 RepID=A0AAD6TH02_9AGAR|nr:hypothetical protein C8F04DRAFT_1249280 [Mycena alexandri]
MNSALALELYFDAEAWWQVPLHVSRARHSLAALRVMAEAERVKEVHKLVSAARPGSWLPCPNLTAPRWRGEGVGCVALLVFSPLFSSLFPCTLALFTSRAFTSRLYLILPVSLQANFGSRPHLFRASRSRHPTPSPPSPDSFCTRESVDIPYHSSIPMTSTRTSFVLFGVFASKEGGLSTYRGGPMGVTRMHACGGVSAVGPDNRWRGQYCRPVADGLLPLARGDVLVGHTTQQ